ncbi:MAG: dihydroorotate dehydrogenase electron transfer subunit [Desulfobacterales bacterium]|jgi:dihydroorotate dehydrogenase electron transfer subunit
MIQQTMASVISHVPMGTAYRRMTLSCPVDLHAARPGQFVMLGTPGGQLLRRPFSIHRMAAGGEGQTEIAILYKIVGAGTEALSHLAAGSEVDFLGPLGQGFRIRNADRRIFIAAGGIGVAPMLFLVEHLVQNAGLSGCEIFLGGRSREDLLCLEDFNQLGVEVHRTTDDGSDGAQCFLTHPLEAAARERPPDVIYACGPMDMLSCVAGIAARLKIACQVSIESAMACGLGACLGCAVAGRSHDGYLHVCKDGPVFDAEQLQW